MAKSGDVLTYTITLNVPFGPANNVVVTDVLPPYLSFVGFGNPPSSGVTQFNLPTNTMTWTFPSLGVGSYSLTYQALVGSYVPQGTILTNKAQVDYTGLSSPKTTSVDVKMATSFTVKIGVYNEAGELVKEISVQELSQEITNFSILQTPVITSVNGKVYLEVNGQEIATWDGTDKAGNPVSNGSYYVQVSNVDPFGVVNNVAQIVTVSRSIAKIEVDIYNEAGEVVKHLYAYADDPGNLALGNVQLSTNLIQPTVQGSATGTNQVVMTFPNGLTLYWDGKGDDGQIVTNGRYELEVHWTDGKGGEEVLTKGISVQRGNNPVTDGNVYASPNLLKGTSSTLVKVNSATGFTLVVGLYDTAGELVKTPVRGQAGANQAPLDVSGLASGIYFAVVDLLDSNGHFVQKQTTKILIQK